MVIFSPCLFFNWVCSPLVVIKSQRGVDLGNGISLLPLWLETKRILWEKIVVYNFFSFYLFLFAPYLPLVSTNKRSTVQISRILGANLCSLLQVIILLLRNSTWLARDYLFMSYQVTMWPKLPILNCVLSDPFSHRLGTNSSNLLSNGNGICSLRDWTWSGLEGINRLYEQVAQMPLMPTSVSLLPLL